MDAKLVCNLGLAKLGHSINNLEPPTSSLEKHCASNYAQWKRSELAKRRWVFSTKYSSLNLDLTATVTVERPFAFVIPPDVLRLIRPKAAQWERNGNRILHSENTLSIKHVYDVPENDCEPLFIDTLALRVAMECVEKVSESNVKFATLERWYNSAIRAAGQQNAIIIGPEDNAEPDEIDTWHAARHGVGV